MNLENFLDSKNLSWKTGRTEGDFSVCCPFCGDSRYRLGLSTAKRAAHCFNCRWHASLYAFIKRLNSGVGLRLELGQSRGRFGGQQQTLDLPSDFQLLADVESGEFGYGAIRAYAESRGVTQTDMERYFIGGCLDGKQGNRVVFPLFEGETLHSYVGRAVFGQEPKYLNASGGISALWGFDPERIGAVVILTEGILKSLAMQKISTGCLHLAMLRNDLNMTQVAQLAKIQPKRVIVIPDPGRPGIEGFLNISRVLDNQIETPWPLPDAQADEVPGATRVRWLKSLVKMSGTLRAEIQRVWLKDVVYF